MIMDNIINIAVIDSPVTKPIDKNKLLFNVIVYCSIIFILNEIYKLLEVVTDILLVAVTIQIKQ